MFARNTTFIIGAGASCELNLPSGEQLMTDITELLAPSDQNLYGFADEAFCKEIQASLASFTEERRAAIAELQRARDVILAALPWSPSIDNLLHNHNEDAWVKRLGKAAIAWCILHAEANSHFFPSLSQAELFSLAYGDAPLLPRDPQIRGEELQESWYRPFAQILFSQVRWPDLSNALRNVRFVIFNYDRCFEHFLFHAIQDQYNVDPKLAAEVLGNTTFVHPYGTLGPLPWQFHIDDPKLGLGDLKNAPSIFSVGSNLKTFTESLDSHTVDTVKTHVGMAATLIFLGFGFLKQNIELIRPYERSATQIYATAYGLSEPNKDAAKSILSSFLDRLSVEPFIEGGRCSSLFSNYRMKLAA